ncbi:MAG: ankyrin repeat domain-containing protein [Terracidiphilus sp.]
MRGGDTARVARLLSGGANPNSRKCCYYDFLNNIGVTQIFEEDTPLGIAIENNKREIVRLLLDAGADPNLPSSSGGSPLVIALEHRHQKIVTVLLAHGADPNRPDPHNSTPFMIADEYGELDAQKALLAAGADPRPRERIPGKPESYSPSDGDE